MRAGIFGFLASMIFWGHKSDYSTLTGVGKLDNSWMIFTLGWLLQIPLSARFFYLAIKG